MHRTIPALFTPWLTPTGADDQNFEIGSDASGS
jgi:hypothetical protein